MGRTNLCAHYQKNQDFIFKLPTFTYSLSSNYHNWWNTTLRYWKHLVGLKQPKIMMTGLNPCLSLVCLLQPKSSGFVANGASAEFCLLLQNCSRRLKRVKIPLLKPEQQRHVSSGRKLAYGWNWEHLIIIVCTLTREHGLTECSIGWKRQFCGQKALIVFTETTWQGVCCQSLSHLISLITLAHFIPSHLSAIIHANTLLD